MNTAHNLNTANINATAADYIAQGITYQITDEGLGNLLAASEETEHMDLDRVRDAIENLTDTLSAEENTNGWHVVDAKGGVWRPAEYSAAEINASSDPAATVLRICKDDNERDGWSA